MDAKKTTLLILNGVRHDFDLVKTAAASAPIITISVSDLHALPHCGGPAESLVEHRPETVEATERELVFFKQGAGYTVLMGRKKLEADLTRPVDETTAAKRREAPTEIRGRLISTPALKRCRVESEQQPQQAAHGEPQRRWSREDNAPSYVAPSNSERILKSAGGAMDEFEPVMPSGQRKLSSRSMELLEQEIARQPKKQVQLSTIVHRSPLVEDQRDSRSQRAAQRPGVRFNDRYRTGT